MIDHSVHRPEHPIHDHAPPQVRGIVANDRVGVQSRPAGHGLPLKSRAPILATFALELAFFLAALARLSSACSALKCPEVLARTRRICDCLICRLSCLSNTFRREDWLNRLFITLMPDTSPSMCWTPGAPSSTAHDAAGAALALSTAAADYGRSDCALPRRGNKVELQDVVGDHARLHVARDHRPKLLVLPKVRFGDSIDGELAQVVEAMDAHRDAAQHPGHFAFLGDVEAELVVQVREVDVEARQPAEAAACHHLLPEGEPPQHHCGEPLRVDESGEEHNHDLAPVH
eukprot:CAMPEP_0182855920 /NCGR_PEP_ID=MMETSP0034_2-20130328/2133_1 /TAXON_ID=156128 /ORGANISM="Nephroselmis pyriformis, Strain CCMP717" /LENGTH=287 /DNA_ID=CAMNT_0024986951 /DNA_START=35 /DNA_END=901 /DNA_ORIENTATION=-